MSVFSPFTEGSFVIPADSWVEGDGRNGSMGVLDGTDGSTGGRVAGDGTNGIEDGTTGSGDGIAARGLGAKKGVGAGDGGIARVVLCGAGEGP